MCKVCCKALSNRKKSVQAHLVLSVYFGEARGIKMKQEFEGWKKAIWDLEKFADNIAGIDDRGSRVTYEELDDFADRIGYTIGKRNLVFLIASNTIDSMAGYVGCLNSGNVPVMLSEDLDIQQLWNLYNTYQPEYIYTRRGRIDETWVREPVLSYKKDNKENGGNNGYAFYRTKGEPGYDIYSQLALLLTTSGSTGSPKLVRQSYDNIRANMDSIVEYLELDEREKPITTLPMNYTYGLSIINSHLAVGAAILFTEKSIMQREFWDFFKREEATSFGGVPYTYEILKKLRIFGMDLPTLRTMTQAGGKLSPMLHKEFASYAESTGRKFVVMYGQTEATARMAYLPADKSLKKYGSMGIAIPGGEFQLIDMDGKEINTPDVVGELVYKGKNVTLGYAEKRVDLIKTDENHGILYTGDMAQKDEDGYYYIVGRKKRFLKIFGKRINLDEVGNLIKDNFEGLDCAAAGNDDAMYLFIDDGKLEKQVECFVHEKLSISQKAIHVKVLEEIPKNDAGKILYTKLESYYD